MKSHCYFIGTSLGDNPVPDHFMALAKELVRRGHRVVILAPHRRLDLENRHGNPAIYTWPSERPTKLRDALFLSRLIRECRPACLIANFAAVNLMTLTGWLAGVPARVVWYHTISGQLAQDSRTPAWKTKLLNGRKRMVYHAATHIVANSAATAADVQQVYGVPKSKCRMFFNSLADPMTEPPRTAAPPVNGKLICVGRLFPSKGQDVLIRALAILKKKLDPVWVEFVGEGPSLGAYQKLARELEVEDACVFAGRVEHGEVLKKMAMSVATVVPSRSEAFGLVNIESMAMGTPVVASAVGGIVEIVRDGRDGFLIPPNDPEALALKLATMLSNSGLRREMSRQSRERFLAAFEQQRAVREQADWHEALVSGALEIPATSVTYGTPA